MKVLIESPEVKVISALRKAIFDFTFNHVESGHDRVALKKWVSSRVDAFQDQCDVIAIEEFELVLMWFYVQLKAEWSQVNTHYQYAQMYAQRTDRMLHYKRGILHAIINAIEEHINLLHVDGVTSFLSLPMNDFDPY
jgi:hypothetical protein